jgi:hypothetical protein
VALVRVVLGVRVARAPPVVLQSVARAAHPAGPAALPAVGPVLRGRPALRVPARTMGSPASPASLGPGVRSQASRVPARPPRQAGCPRRPSPVPAARTSRPLEQAGLLVALEALPGRPRRPRADQGAIAHRPPAVVARRPIAPRPFAAAPDPARSRAAASPVPQEGPASRVRPLVACPAGRPVGRSPAMAAVPARRRAPARRAPGSRAATSVPTARTSGSPGTPRRPADPFRVRPRVVRLRRPRTSRP